MKIKRIRKSAADLSFDLISTIIMIFVLLVTLYPFWYVLVGSFSSVGHLIKGGFVLWPDGIHLDAYAQVFRNDMIPTAYRNTLIITIGSMLYCFRYSPGVHRQYFVKARLKFCVAS